MKTITKTGDKKVTISEEISRVVDIEVLRYEIINLNHERNRTVGERNERDERIDAIDQEIADKEAELEEILTAVPDLDEPPV